MNEPKRSDANKNQFNPKRLNSEPLADEILETVPSLDGDLQSLMNVAQTDLDQQVYDEEPDETDPPTETARLGEAIAQIRALVEDHRKSACETTGEEPNSKPEKPAPARNAVQRQQEDRWADLREAFAEDLEEGTTETAAPAAKKMRRTSSIERVGLGKRRQVADAQGTAASAGNPAADATTPHDWDTTEDHKMSRGGRFVWNTAVCGGIVAIPALLFVTSPFAPQATAKHYVAAFGCSAAKAVGVDRATEGEPGYHPSLDDNNNGVACEPQYGTSFARGGGAFQNLR